MFIPDFMIRSYCTDPVSKYELGDIVTDIRDSEPLISPFNEENLGAASYDLTLAANFSSPSELQAFIYRDGVKHHALEPSKDYNNVKLKPNEQIGIIINPGQPILCHAQERVSVPPFIVVQLYTRSSYARQWLNHSTATGIWPGFKGQITFELKNEGVEPIVVKSGDKIVQIAFCQMVAPAANLYNGIYQNQKAQLHSLRKIDTDTVMPE